MRTTKLVTVCLALGLLALAQTKSGGKGDAAKGKALFESQNCATCHSVGADKKMGPGLKGLFTKSKLQNGKKPSEQTVAAVVDAGGNGMPGYKDMLSAQEKTDLLAFLKTL